MGTPPLIAQFLAGMVKLCSLGGLFILYLVDVVLIALQVGVSLVELQSSNAASGSGRRLSVPHALLRSTSDACPIQQRDLHAGLP